MNCRFGCTKYGNGRSRFRSGDWSSAATKRDRSHPPLRSKLDPCAKARIFFTECKAVYHPLKSGKPGKPREKRGIQTKRWQTFERSKPLHLAVSRQAERAAERAEMLVTRCPLTGYTVRPDPVRRKSACAVDRRSCTHLSAASKTGVARSPRFSYMKSPPNPGSRDNTTPPPGSEPTIRECLPRVSPCF